MSLKRFKTMDIVIFIVLAAVFEYINFFASTSFKDFKIHGVHPFHLAWLSIGYIFDHDPGLLTTIIMATVSPLRISRETYLLTVGFIYIWFAMQN